MCAQYFCVRPLNMKNADPLQRAKKLNSFAEHCVFIQFFCNYLEARGGGSHDCLQYPHSQTRCFRYRQGYMYGNGRGDRSLGNKILKQWFGGEGG